MFGTVLLGAAACAAPLASSGDPGLRVSSGPTDQQTAGTPAATPTAVPTAPETPRLGGEAIVLLENPIHGLDPHLDSSVTRAMLTPLVYSTLVRFDENMALQPDLAERWELGPDGLSLTFWLRQGVRWHPPVGDELTSADVRFSLLRMRDELPDGRDCQLIKDVEAIDKYQVRILLEQPTAALLPTLADPRFSAIVNREVTLKHENLRETHIGTGPFVSEHWDVGRELRLTRNPNYHLGQPPLERITIRTVSPGTVEDALIRGAGHLATFVPGALPASLESAPTVKVSPGPNAVAFLAFNQKRPAFAAPERAAAIRSLVKPDAVAGAVPGSEATGPCPAILERWRLATPPALPTVPASASQAGSPFKIMVPAGQPWLSAVAQSVERQLKPAGVPVQIEMVPPAIWVRRWASDDCDASIASTRGYVDPDSYFRRAVHKDGQLWANWWDAEVDSLLDDARAEMDFARRKGLYDTIQRRILDKAPVVWLCSRNGSFATSIALGGFRPHPLGHLGPLASAWVA